MRCRARERRRGPRLLDHALGEGEMAGCGTKGAIAGGRPDRIRRRRPVGMGGHVM